MLAWMRGGVAGVLSLAGIYCLSLWIIELVRPPPPTTIRAALAECSEASRWNALNFSAKINESREHTFVVFAGGGKIAVQARGKRCPNCRGLRPKHETWCMESLGHVS